MNNFINVDAIEGGKVVVAVHGPTGDVAATIKPQAARQMARLLIAAADTAEAGRLARSTIDLDWKPLTRPADGADA